MRHIPIAPEHLLPCSRRGRGGLPQPHETYKCTVATDRLVNGPVAWHKKLPAPQTLRIDLLDQHGNTSAIQDLIFRLDPLNADGQTHHYVYYFGDLYTQPVADFDAVHILRFYTNYGSLAAPETGQYSLHSVAFTPASDPTVPALPSEPGARWLAESEDVEITWTDNATNESFYAVYRKKVEDADYIVLALRLPVDSEAYTDKTARRGQEYLYRISVRNQFGENVLQDVIPFQTPEITALQDPQPQYFKLWPNPAAGQVKLLLPEGSFEVRVMDLTGRVFVHLPAAKHLLHITTSDWPGGTYIAQLKGKERVYRARLLVQH